MADVHVLRRTFVKSMCRKECRIIATKMFIKISTVYVDGNNLFEQSCNKFDLRLRSRLLKNQQRFNDQGPSVFE